jgi:CRISPR-associated protein Csb2
MPNNDSDSIGGDPAQMAKIRTATKVFRPYLFDPSATLVYGWQVGGSPEDEHQASAICGLADRLYQLGRGIDMAWAWGETIDDVALEELLESYQGRILRPSESGVGITLPAPMAGSLASVLDRYKAYAERFSYRKSGRSVQVAFRQPPKARFRLVPYDSPSWRQLYEIRKTSTESAFAPWPLERINRLTIVLRDAAVERLKRAMPARSAEIERILVGRKADGTNDCPAEKRLRIIPLPSIGHFHADREIRRVLVEAPPGCPMRPDDVNWTFSGLPVVPPGPSETPARLIPANDESPLRHYGIADEKAHRVWRSVTPAALPEDARRRRIEPARKSQDAKGGPERKAEEARAATAVVQAIRHAGVLTTVESIHLQREPFEGNGSRAEAFAEGTRFDKHRLWHVEIEFGAPLSGPLAIGDGRNLGLGIMAPVVKRSGVYVFGVESGLMEPADGEGIARALRRAVMARVQEQVDGPLPAYFSGHEINGSPAASAQSPHLTFSFDPTRRRVLVIAPHVLDRRPATQNEMPLLKKLDLALADLRELRAGGAGVLCLRTDRLESENDPLFAPSREWVSLTRYRVTRHVRADDAREAVAEDIRGQLQLRGLPEAKVSVLWCGGAAGRGLEGMVRLEFEVAVSGPLLLGRSRYLGGGLFGRMTREDGEKI